MSTSFEKYRRKKEDLRLEFKGRDALDDGRILPRAVCAMLNAGGGEILVGVKDDGVPEPIPEPESACRRVLDRLVSTVSPSLPQGLVVELLADEPVLRIGVPENEAGVVYAVKSSEGRLLVPVRTGDRTQVLDWPEVVRRVLIASATAGVTTRTERERARSLLQSWVEESQMASASLSASGGLFLVLCANPESKNDWRDAVRGPLAEALLNPESIGVRREGWHFSTLTSLGGHAQPFVEQNGQVLTAGERERAYRYIKLIADGDMVLRFVTRFDEAMRWSHSPSDKKASRVVHPYAISETVSSCCQLFSWLLSKLELRPDSVGAALELTRTNGLLLPPFRPGALGFDEPFHWPPPQSQDSVLAYRELTEAFVERPHQLARLVLTDLYRGFGHDAEAVPFWNEHEERFIYR